MLLANIAILFYLHFSSSLYSVPMFKRKDDLLYKKYGYRLPNPEYTDIKPAWKYAFYNPAKRDDNNNVVIKRSSWTLFPPVWSTFVAGMCLHNSLLIYLGVLIVIWGFTYCFFKIAVTIMVNEKGIFLGKKSFSWNDYQAAYFTTTEERAKSSVHILLLLTTNNKIEEVAMPQYLDINKIGTAIRDFQPPAWKEHTLDN